MALSFPTHNAGLGAPRCVGRPVLRTYALVCRAAGAVKIDAGTAAAVRLPVLPGFAVEVGRVLPGNRARGLRRRFAHLHIQHSWFWLAGELKQWLAEVEVIVRPAE